MFRFLFLVVALSAAISCKDKPYDEAITEEVTFESRNISSNITITSPANNGFLNTQTVKIMGSLSKDLLDKEVWIEYAPMLNNKESQSFEVRAEVSRQGNSFAAVLDQSLSEGSFKVIAFAVASDDEKQVSKAVKFHIDRKEPQIFGAEQEIKQAPYIQENSQSVQIFVADDDNPQFMIKPTSEAKPLEFANSPIIYRWLTRIDDDNTAPSYRFEVKDDLGFSQVRYRIAQECSSFEKCTRTSKGKKGRHEIKLVQSQADVDLGKDSSTNEANETYCLSIWASDKAGNTHNHDVEFYWRVSMPPIAVDANSTLHQAFMYSDDIIYERQKPRRIFMTGGPLRLPQGLVLGHVLLVNPHNVDVALKLDFISDIELIISGVKYKLNDELEINYYSYDLAKDIIKEKIELKKDWAVVGKRQALIARFMLADMFRAKKNQIESLSKFLRSVEYSTSFVPQEYRYNLKIIEGLRLFIASPEEKFAAFSRLVPWGERHMERGRKQ